MLLNFSDLEIEEKLNIYQNGADVVKFFQWVIMDPEVDDEIQPVSLLLLDINMPIMHGLECSEKINQMYKEQNQERLKQNKPPLVSPCGSKLTNKSLLQNYIIVFHVSFDKKNYVFSFNLKGRPMCLA